jgi:hypothetical protein
MQKTWSIRQQNTIPNLHPQYRLVPVKKWTNEITSAERQRLKNPRAMDIIGAHHHSNSDSAGSVSNPSRLPQFQWLDLALSIEERQ